MARRTCDKCGSRMQPHVPRKKLGSIQVCEGCFTLNKTSSAPDVSFRTTKGKRSGIAHTTIHAYLGEDKAGSARMIDQGRTLDDLYVHPDHRGKGVGHALMGEVLRQFGHNTIDLHASPFSQGKKDQGGLDAKTLQDFYRGHGFTSQGDSAYMSRKPPAARTAVLHNPTQELRGGHPQTWYHGSPHEFEEFGHGGREHWNTFLGTHFSAQPEIARQFAYGEHEDEPGEEMPAGHVVSAKLHIKRPKTYRSEFEMDQAAHEWAHGKGYLVGKHIAEHPEEYQDDEPDDEDDEYGGWGDDDPEEHERKQIRDARLAYAQREDKPFHKHESDFGFPTRHSFRPAATGWLNSHPHKEEIAQGFKSHLKSQGYDGIVYGNEIEQNAGDTGPKHLPYHSHPPLEMPDANRQASDAPQHHISAVAFEPHQIEITKHEYDPEYKTWEQRNPQDLQHPLPGMERDAAKRRVYQPPVHVYYHGTANEPENDTSGESSHVIPAGAQVHPDEHTAWKHAINQWREDESSAFPRVYALPVKGVFGDKPNVVGEPTTNRGLRLTKPATAREQPYNADKHPPIRLEDEPEHILYHGTTHYHEPDDEDLEGHEPPEEITPNTGRQTFGPGVASPDHAYATRNPHTAWTYAEKRKENVGGTPHVYRVTPKNPRDVEDDPHYSGDYNRGNYEGDMRSPSGFDVLDEVPPTRKLHEELKDDHREENDSGWSSGEDEDEEHHFGSRTAAWTMKYTTYGPEGYVDKERQVEGPLYHGSRSKSLDTGDLITPKRKPNPWGDEGPKSTHVYFTENLSTAQSYADQAGGHVYEVEPTGEFHTDYNGEDYKSPHPLRVLRRHQAGRTAARNHLGDPTDWDEHYDSVPDKVHRGIPFKPPTALWKQMDEDGDPQGIAQEIARRTSRKASTGLHWSGELAQARDFSEQGSKHFRGEVPIVLHGQRPAREDIETRPAMLKRREIFPYTHAEKEIPVRKGRDVMVTAVSWKHPEKGWQRHELAQRVPHTAATADEYAKQDAGRQDVWQVQTEGKVQPLCDYHCQAALGRDRAANSLGAYYDLGQEPSGRLSGPEKGSCAHCGRNTTELLQGLNRGVSRHDYRDSQQPRNRRTGPYMPTRTKPFQPIKQSESAWNTPEWEETDEQVRDPSESLDARRDRHIDRISELHDIGRRRAAQVYDVVAHDSATKSHVDPRDYGFHKSHLGGDPLTPQEWHETSPETIDLTKHKLHTVQSWLSPAGVAHKLFHPEGRYPEEDERFVGDPDHDPDEGHDDEGWGHQDDDQRPPGDYARVIHHQGRYHVINGNHRLAVDLLTGQPHAMARVYHAADDEFESPTSKEGSAMTSLRRQAHDASENQDLRHCPFCGSGKIIGRADGTVECEFCHNYFTVQVQPQFPNFPQTMNGMPMSIPGMPGQVETPSGVGPNGEDMGAMPPGQEGMEGGGVPSDLDGDSDETEESEDTQAEPPPFAKSSFRTVTGALLPEDDYVRHLAIHLATDRSAMIARIRDERGQ
jgi:GNAT superfamily N-acetyltransferase/ribosomal protein L37AE/L43A